MKKISVLIVFSFVFLFSNAQNFIAPAQIDSDTTWSADTVYLKNDLIISNGVKLTIMPSTVVMSDGFWGIYVNGCINAIGTEQENIYFTAKDTTGFADSSLVTGGWKGLYFINTSHLNDSSIFHYCVLEYGKAFGKEDIEQKGGVLYLTGFDKIRISYSTIQNNSALNWGGGLFMEYCSGIICNNKFFHNMTYNYGGAIYMGKKSDGLIISNLFKYNVAYLAGGAVYVNTVDMESQAPKVLNNWVFNNTSPSGIVYESTVNATIANNVICNNYGTPIYNGHTLGRAKYINNTIANNDLVSMEMNVIGVNSKKVSIVNNIIWNNYNKNYKAVDTQLINLMTVNPDSVQYNLLIGNNFNGNGNLFDLDPQFINPSPNIGIEVDGEVYDWRLQDSSPLINKGKPYSNIIYYLPNTDILGPRINQNLIDLGAFENQTIMNLSEDMNSNKVKFYPNPAKDYIRLNISDNSTGNVQIFDLTGQLKLEEFINSNEVEKTLDISKFSKGIYIVKFGESVQKLIIN